MYNFQRFENFAPVREQIIDVFYTSFSASEGETEGSVIRTLVEHLLEMPPNPIYLSLPPCIMTPSSVARYFRV